MKRIIIILTLILITMACSDDKTPIQPEKNVESMYSWLNLKGATKWNYDKRTHMRGKPWVDEVPEYGTYEINSDTSATFVLHKISDNSISFKMDLSYDSTQLYMNTFSLGDDFIDPILKKLDFNRLKIADLNLKEWSIDTLFYKDIALDDKNTFYGYIAFKVNRLEDSTVIYNGSEKTLKRFQLLVRVIAYQVEKGYLFTVYPGYYFGIIDGVGFYNIKLWNHTNTAIFVPEFEYTLKGVKKE